MKWLTNFLNTSVGRKQLMALSGLGLSGFLVTHLSGNFLLLVGDGGEKFNSYAEWLGGQFWLNGARAGLLLTLFVHLYLAFRLTFQNRTARGGRYVSKNASDASLASRTMILTGILILGFVVMHLFDFTWAEKPDGLYAVVVAKFAQPVWSLVYVICMIVVMLHLIHAIQSVFQTFGLNHAKYTPIIKKISLIVAVGLMLGFISIPIWLFISLGGA